jgi:hypothetical protein
MFHAKRRFVMTIYRFRTYAGLILLQILPLGCNRKNYEAHEYHAPLSTPAPVPEGEYSSPAATTPAQVAPVNQTAKVPDDDKAAQKNLPGYYFHCPPPGTTPPSAPMVKDGSLLNAVDCPPGDPNASTSQVGLPGTPALTKESTLYKKGDHPPVEDRENNIGP